MKCLTAVIFFVSALTQQAWSKPNDNAQYSINDRGTNVGRLGSALGQTVGAGYDSVQQLGAGVLGQVGGLVAGLGSGLQAGLNPGRRDHNEGRRRNVDLNGGVNGPGKSKVGANGYNDRGAYPNNYPINTKNAGNGLGSGVDMRYRPSAEYGHGANYGGSNGIQRMQYPEGNVYTDYPNPHLYNPHGVGYGGGHGYQSIVPPVYPGPHPYNTLYNMNDPRIGVSYGPGYIPADEYVNSGYYDPGHHYPPAIDQGYQYNVGQVHPDHIYPQYFPSNANNARLDDESVNDGGFDSGARSHRLRNTDRNINNNRASHPSNYPNSNNAGRRTVYANDYDDRLEYDDAVGVRSANGQGSRADNRFTVKTGARRGANVAPVSRRRQEPNYDDSSEEAFDERYGSGSSGTRITGPSDEITVGPNNDGRLESGSTGNGTRQWNGTRNGAESNSRLSTEGGVGKEARPSVVAGTQSDAKTIADNEAGIPRRV